MNITRERWTDIGTVVVISTGGGISSFLDPKLIIAELSILVQAVDLT